MKRAPLLSFVVVVVVAGACTPQGPVPAAEYGAQLFSDASFSDSEFNEFSCATCHVGRDVVDGRIYAGADLNDSVHRGSWWGGSASRYIDAVNHCYVYFMRGKPLASDDPRGRALYEHLLSLSSDAPAAPVLVTVVENVTTVPRGDPARGEQVYDGACKHCHGAPHTGDGRISPLLSIVPEASVEFAEKFDPPFDPALVIVEKVRHGPFFGVGGNMPFFSTEVLSDADLGALIAYLGL